ncbi:hypothetical protein HID58_000338, partial [Brassica napus]
LFNCCKNVSSLVTRACDPSGDNKVMGHWTDLFGPDSERLFTGLPVPKRRRPREAGFTEQRPPPAFVGGRITGRCLLSPV